MRLGRVRCGIGPGWDILAIFVEVLSEITKIFKSFGPKGTRKYGELFFYGWIVVFEKIGSRGSKFLYFGKPG